MKKPKAKKRAAKKAKHPLVMKPAVRFAAQQVVDKVIARAPKAVDEIRATPGVVGTISPAEGVKIPKGLVEVSIAGTHLTLLGMQNQAATPTMEQRLAIAGRLLEVGPKLPKYVKEMSSEQMTPITSIGLTAMGRKDLVGLDPKEVQKAFDANRKDNIEREKEAKKAADKKAKEDAAKAAAESKARKKLKQMDVRPKVVVEPEPAPVKGKAKGKAGKGADPSAQVKGISSPPPRPKASMNPSAPPKGGFNKDNRPATSGELIRSLIMEHKMTDDAIASLVRKLWPGRTTAVSDVRWNRAQMQKANVKNVPDPVEGSTVPSGRK